MTNYEPERNETIAQILDAHDADSVDELPVPVQNVIRASPNASYDSGHGLAVLGDR